MKTQTIDTLTIDTSAGDVPDEAPRPREHRRVSALVFDQPWAILPERLEALCAVLDRVAAGEAKDPAFAAAAPAQGSRTGGVAVVPVRGVLAHRMNMMTEISGGTSTEVLGRQLQMLDRDPEVAAIVLDVNSPGGEVFGIEELAGQIRGMSTRVVAQANAMAASAAYWLVAQADEVVMTPSGVVGSVGVIAQHVDRTGQDAAEGVKRTLVTAGEGKADLSEPLTDESLSRIQATVDRYYGQFVAGVVEGRNAAAAARDGRTSAGRRRLTAEIVEDEWQAQIMTSERALALGMVDGVADLDTTIRTELDRARVAGEDRQRQRRATRARLGV